MISIYTDGSYRSKSLLGGYGFIAVEDGEVLNTEVNREQNTTNQRCEIKGILEAYKWCEKNNIVDGIIYSDSAYCVRCFTDRWYDKWIANGFLNTKGIPVANRDLWEKLIPYYQNSFIQLRKVKGHNGNYYNEIIDKFVSGASESSSRDFIEVDNIKIKINNSI